MKTVFNNSECFHRFVNQDIPRGRNSNNTIFWENDIIYSYGYHYPLGRFATNDILLVCIISYSVTTPRHASLLKQAASHKTIIELPFILNGTVEFTVHNLEYFCNKFEALLDKQALSRVRDYSQELLKVKSYLIMLLPLVNKSLIPHDLNTRVNYVKNFNIDSIQKTELKEKTLEKIRKNKEKRLAEFLEKLHKFHAFEIPRINDLEYTVFRFNKKTNEFESSKQVKIPLNEASVIWNRIKENKPIHGLKVSGYTITSFDGKILIAGCHKVKIEEINKIGQIIDTLLTRGKK